MNINIEVTGLKELQSSLKDFSTRRFNSVVATALTRTAKTLSQSWQGEVGKAFDRPTARTLNAVGFTGANAAKLESRVFLKDKMQGTAPSVYLAPQEHGGSRLLKKFERALVSSGAMPAGYFTVPGKHATLDANGNVARGQLIAVIRALGSQYSPGYERNISKSTAKRLQAQARHGRQYIAVSPAEARRFRVSAGIYERLQDGSRKAVFLFKKSLGYEKRLRLKDRIGEQEVRGIFSSELDRALSDSLARLAARGAVP